MAVYKRGKIWWYKFNWNGEPIRESTKQTNKRIAEQMEAAHKTSLAKGEVGIRDRKPVPTVAGSLPRMISCRTFGRASRTSLDSGLLRNSS